MNKEELVRGIEKIPQFVLRDIKIVGNNKVVDEKNWKAVTEDINEKPLTFVTERYKLIQFKDVFTPLVQNIPELDGEVSYFDGFGIIDIFPEDEKLKNGEDRIGMVAYNSVNKTSSVIVNFCVRHGKKKITIPRNIAGFKKVHSGKILDMTKNFLEVAENVRSIWNTILNEFSKIKVDEAYATNVLKELDIKDQYITKRTMKKVLTTSDINLWDMFLYIMELVEARRFKSDVHRRKKMDLITAKIFKYATMIKLLNA